MRVEYSLAVPGRHLVMNSLAVLAAVKAVGGDVGQAAAGLGQVEGLPGRGKRHRIALPVGSFELEQGTVIIPTQPSPTLCHVEPRPF